MRALLAIPPSIADKLAQCPSLAEEIERLRANDRVLLVRTDALLASDRLTDAERVEVLNCQAAVRAREAQLASTRAKLSAVVIDGRRTTGEAAQIVAKRLAGLSVWVLLNFFATLYLTRQGFSPLIGLAAAIPAAFLLLSLQACLFVLTRDWWRIGTLMRDPRIASLPGISSPSLVLPPGTRLDALCRFLPRETYALVVAPTIADMQHEYTEALSRRDARGARQAAFWGRVAVVRALLKLVPGWVWAALVYLASRVTGSGD